MSPDETERADLRRKLGGSGWTDEELDRAEAIANTAPPVRAYPGRVI